MYVMSISNRGALPIKESNSKQPHKKHPLPNPKNLGGGNFKKYAKGLSGGARPPLGGQAARLRLRFCAKMGSSEFKKSLQVGRN